jgi:hypothetical protein
MSKIMMYQNKPDINLSTITVFSGLNERREGVQIFDMIKRGDRVDNLTFKIVFDVSNASSCGGSIKKPDLLIIINNFPYFLFPRTEERMSQEGGDGTVYFVSKNEKNIFLKGGEMKSIELYYNIKNSDPETVNQLFGVIKKENISQKQINFELRYKDNLGNLQEMRVNKVI